MGGRQSKDTRPTCSDCKQRVSVVVDGRCDLCNAARAVKALAAQAAAERERQLQIVVPAYRKYLENPGKSVEEWMGQNSLEVPCTTVALVGLPKCGKSTLINQFGCVVAQELIPQLVNQGGGVGVGGHNTLQQRRINLLAKACGASGRPVPEFELTMCDLVGVRCLRELLCALLGKTADRARWPVHPGMSGDEEEKAIREVEERVRTPMNAVHCLVLVMTPETLINMADDTKESIAGILRMAKEFRPNTGAGVEPFELPLRLVITHADLWARSEGCDDARCLLGGAEGFLGPLYAAARKLGFDALYVTPIGWLDRADIDHANGADPRVVVLKFLLHQMRMQSTSYLSDVLAVVGQKCSDSGS
ncbi:Hypothetical protein, putative [Bodo saltans]|uniref:Uncharacterized protein n=1 Tax=Bodo saltans TaxID=75058 RepID=A0A0S4J7K7_BODSA|nr:Hypothetical protein, putative [Bodo saltans]|eukprot:CUG87226.1 Hypothetical protein, putative [Bodo saltans]